MKFFTLFVIVVTTVTTTISAKPIKTTVTLPQATWTDEDKQNVIPNFNCGYSNVEFDDSLNYFQPNDTVWFFYSDGVSNCAEPLGGTPCTSLMYMTGNYGAYFGYVPYSVWYDFEKWGDDQWAVTLRYNYNEGQTSIVDTIPCDRSRNERKSQLSRCMFDEDLYSFGFFKHYQFNFYTTCYYNPKLNEVSLNIDQESVTCTDLYDGTNVVNRFNLVSFTGWTPRESIILSDEPEFCPNCATATTTTTCEPPTPTPTDTYITPVPTETETSTETVTLPCLSCQGEGGGNVNVNVIINNSNSHKQYMPIQL